ncbi:MAG: hypothetical protein ACXWL2_04610 [Candidatus Chromulinivorax sp.]
MQYSSYYQAKIQKELCWIVTSTLRYSEYVAFDRCLDKQESIFEFFVARELEDVFLQIMQKFEKHGIVTDLKHMENRLLDPSQSV